MRAEPTLRPVRRRGAPLASLLAATAAVVGGGCTAADNLSFGEIAAEFDGIVTVAGAGEDRSIVYADTAPVSAWYMRQFWLVPLRWPLARLFGAASTSDIDNPAGHVRELLQELPDELGADSSRCAEAVPRLGWIAEADVNGNSRVVALDGLAAVADQLELELFPPGFESMAAEDNVRLGEARAVVQTLRPEARSGAPVDDAQRQRYCSALAVLAAAPLADWTHRLLLVSDLTDLLAIETDGPARDATAAALRRAIAHCIRGILVRAIVSRDARFVDVRLCAMEIVRRLGGPRMVPWLLAAMAASPEQIARGEPRYDPDPLVQLRLIRYCGQLRGDLAATEVRLPGRDEWQALAPIDFLVQVVLTEQDYYSKLRTPAMAALSLALARPRFDPDPAWVREWNRERRRRD